MRKALLWSLVSAILFGSLVVGVPAFARFIYPPNDRIVRSCPEEDMILKPVVYYGYSTGMQRESRYRCVPAERYVENHSK